MLKLTFKVVKKLIMAFFLLYGLNLIISSSSIIIPINIFSILVTSLLGIPGIITLVALFLLI